VSIRDDDARRRATHLNDRITAPRRGDGEPLPPELAAAVSALRRLPPPAPGATARIVAAATGGPRVERAARGWRERITAARWADAPWRSVAAAVLLAAAIGSAAALRGRPDGAPADVQAPAIAAAPAPTATDDARVALGAAPAPGVLPVAALDAADEAPRPVAFVLHRPGARSVALVGDFNGWSTEATPLAAAGGGTWAITLPLTPGRHAYGFVIDGETWVLDPKAPAARDADYGRDHSVVVVGVP
jgi:hypothetical protein